MTTLDPTLNSGTSPIPAAADAATPPPAPTKAEAAPPVVETADSFEWTSGGESFYVPAAGSIDSDVDLDALLAQIQQSEAAEAKEKITANAREREALFDDRRFLQTELGRTAPPEGLGMGPEGSLDNALWKPKYQSKIGMPSRVYDSAFRYANAVEMLEKADAATTSGGGVRLITGAEREALVPPAMGDVFITEGGFRVDTRDHKIFIYQQDEAGQWQGHTRISGDPHVYTSQNGEDVINKEGGWDWHYGEDSTFILPDGSKIATNSVETKPGSGIFYNRGIDIQSGDQRGFSGLSFEGEMRTAGVTNDRVEFDEANVDTKGTSGGVFAMVGNDWAKLDPNGQAAMVDHESWDGYLATRDVTSSGAAVQLSADQELAVASLTAEDRQYWEDLKAESLAILEPYAIIGDEAIADYQADLTARMDSVDEKITGLNIDLSAILQELQTEIANQKALDTIREAYEQGGETQGQSDVDEGNAKAQTQGLKTGGT